MQKLLLLIYLVIFTSNFNAQTYPSLNINLLAHLNPEKDVTGIDGRKYSGCWGWAQPNKNREYAIIGTSSQTYFVDVTNPTTPVIVDSVKAKHAGCTWREIKTYQNYCYIVSDDAPPNTFQIVDMQYLPDSAHVVHDGTTYFERSHTIFIDNEKMYCGSVTDASGLGYSTMRVYSLATPTAPLLLKKLEQDVNTTIIDVVHDMYVRNDTIYASCGFKGFHILKLTASNTFSLIQSFTGYAYSGYNHSSWQTDDRKTMVFTDEVGAHLPAKVIDVTNFNNITLVDTIRSSYTATAHNPYIVGNRWCWLSSYQDGLYLYDISNPSNTTIYGYFDTQPQTGTTNFSGNWGAYPYLPSKIIIACDMQNGIFILEGDNTYQGSVGMNEQSSQSSMFSVYPNPAKDEIHFLIANQFNKNIQCTITDVLGKLVYNETLNINETFYKTAIHTSILNNGCYFVTLKGNNINETKKILIQN
jgi:choice-of-anchor B domain-containing protein